MKIDTLDIVVVIASLVAALALAAWFAAQADRARAERDDLLDRVAEIGEAHAETRRQLNIAHVRLAIAPPRQSHQEGAHWPVCRCGRPRRAHVNGRRPNAQPGACAASNCPRYEAA